MPILHPLAIIVKRNHNSSHRKTDAGPILAMKNYFIFHPPSDKQAALDQGFNGQPGLYTFYIVINDPHFTWDIPSSNTILVPF